MYLVLIILPLLGSIASGFFGRKIGVTGAQLITCTAVVITTILAVVAFFEVGLNNTPVSIEVFRWIDSESLNVSWGFHFDSLTVSMLIPVLIVSSLVHLYSIGYMSHDPHNQRFFSYLSLFTFMMIILVTSNNFLLMFVGWEGVGVCSYLLVSFWFTRIAANQSSISAFLTNRVGDCFLTIGMFAILWSFGKKTEYNLSKKRELNTYEGNNSKEKIDVGSYLAGLIEGDGHIAVHNGTSKPYRPKIIILFHVNDKPLADKIHSSLKVGRIIDRSRAGHYLLQILAKEEVLKVINLINGKMRTPKIEALHRAINYINNVDNLSIPLLDIDNSTIDSNNWLSGFTDADGNFSITIYDRKKNNNVIRTSVQTYFRIEVKQSYSNIHSPVNNNINYFSIMTKITEFFTVNLYTRTRTVKDKTYHSYMAIAHNSNSHEIVRKYFDRYPLFSSKHLAYLDWCKVQDLHKNNLSKNDLEKIKLIKSKFNKNRTVFNFSHLDKFIY